MPVLHKLLDWQGQNKGCPLAESASGGNSAAVAFDDFTTDCQTDAGAFVGAASVQSLENGKNAIAIFFLKTDAVVTCLNVNFMFST